MTDEIDTPLDDSGTESVETSEYDTELELDDLDLEEEGTEDDLEDGEIEGEEGEADEQPDEDSDDEPEDQQEAEPEAVKPDAVVKLPDGTETTVEELTKGHLRQADYSRKTQEVAERRKAVEAEAARIKSVTDAFIERISSLIPNEPETALAYTNPGQYTAQKAAYDSAIAQVKDLINISKEAEGVKGSMTEQQRREMLQAENAKLIEKFPEAGTKEGREKFFSSVQSVAEEIGFTTQELSQVSDHRVFALAHWAKKGMEAEKAKTKVREKAQKAPPTAPRKPGQGARKNDAAARRKARAALVKDDSIENAIRLLSQNS
jgi:FtsZ-binding cell division protein ZapB